MHTAAEKGNAEFVRHCLEKCGINIHCLSKGKTIFDVALESQAIKVLAVIFKIATKYNIEEYASFNLRSSQETNFLLQAAMRHCKDSELLPYESDSSVLQGLF